MQLTLCGAQRGQHIALLPIHTSSAVDKIIQDFQDTLPNGDEVLPTAVINSLAQFFSSTPAPADLPIMLRILEVVLAEVVASQEHCFSRGKLHHSVRGGACGISR
jgi:hypothetical protein